MIRTSAILAAAFLFAVPASARTPTGISVFRALSTCNVRFNLTKNVGDPIGSNQACNAVAVTDAGGLRVDFTMAASSTSFKKVSFGLAKVEPSSEGPSVFQTTLHLRDGKSTTGKTVGYCDLTRFAPKHTVNVFRCVAIKGGANDTLVSIAATGVISGQVEPGFFAALQKPPKGNEHI